MALVSRPPRPRSSVPSRLARRALVGAALVIAVLGCGCDSDDSDDDLGDTQPVVNECGTFDPDEQGTDSVIPQDPADPEIVSSCETLCDAYATIEGCGVDLEDCVESCRLRSCDVCPGSLADLTDCEAELFEPGACTCQDGVVTCETPAGCSDELTSTGACGG